MDRKIKVALAHMESHIDDLMETRAMAIRTSNTPEETEEYIDNFIEKKLAEYKEAYKDMSAEKILFNALGRIGIKVEDDGKAKAD